ncbi:hypothetical protein GCM10028804_17010 [Larkinella terrae]
MENARADHLDYDGNGGNGRQAGPDPEQGRQKNANCPQKIEYAGEFHEFRGNLRRPRPHPGKLGNWLKKFQVGRPAETGGNENLGNP